MEQWDGLCNDKGKAEPEPKLARKEAKTGTDWVVGRGGGKGKDVEEEPSCEGA